MRIELNGEPRDVPAADSLAALLAELGKDVRGVAVALDGQVVPRARWADTAVADGAALEVLTAVQGG